MLNSPTLNELHELKPYFSEQELAEMDALIKSEPAPFDDWLPTVTPTFNWDWPYLAYIRQHLDKVTSGEIKRLILCIPPRHGKTEMTTIRYPVWRLERDPELRVIIGSYNQILANKFSRKARRIASQRIAMSKDRVAVEDWETAKGGGIRSVGVGAGITGQGGNLIIIDDPVKSREEAESAAYRERCWEWYTDDLYTRLEPDGAIILILTRWHMDDLAGRILESEDGPNWTVINLPAEAGLDDPLGREVGQALCPERFNEAELASIKTVLGSSSYYALYQQRPSPVEGAIWKREYWRYYDTPPRCYFILQAWDTAFKEKDSADRSACSTWGIAEHGIYLLDVWAGRLEFPQLVEMAKRQYERLKPSPNVVVVEDHASGQSLIQVLRQETKLPIVGRKMETSKEVRAWAVVGLAEAGRLFLPANAPWLGEYLAEMESFPHGKFDDQVDSTTLALNYLRGMVGDRLTAGSDADHDELDPTLEEDYAKKQARQTLEFGRGSEMAPYRASRWGKIRSKR